MMGLGALERAPSFHLTENAQLADGADDSPPVEQAEPFGMESCNQGGIEPVKPIEGATRRTASVFEQVGVETAVQLALVP